MPTATVANMTVPRRSFLWSPPAAQRTGQAQVALEQRRAARHHPRRRRRPQHSSSYAAPTPGRGPRRSTGTTPLLLTSRSRNSSPTLSGRRRPAPQPHRPPPKEHDLDLAAVHLLRTREPGVAHPPRDGADGPRPGPHRQRPHRLHDDLVRAACHRQPDRHRGHPAPHGGQGYPLTPASHTPEQAAGRRRLQLDAPLNARTRAGSTAAPAPATRLPRAGEPRSMSGNGSGARCPGPRAGRCATHRPGSRTRRQGQRHVLPQAQVAAGRQEAEDPERAHDDGA